MKLIIFGATGSVGQHLVQQALAAGHEVTAFTRQRSKVDFDDQRLRVYEGDVLDARTVAAALEGQSVVLCTLGAGRKGTVRTEGTENIVQGMQAQGTR